MLTTHFDVSLELNTGEREFIGAYQTREEAHSVASSLIGERTDFYAINVREELNPQSTQELDAELKHMLASIQAEQKESGDKSGVASARYNDMIALTLALVDSMEVS